MTRDIYKFIDECLERETLGNRVVKSITIDFFMAAVHIRDYLLGYAGSRKNRTNTLLLIGEWYGLYKGLAEILRRMLESKDYKYTKRSLHDETIEEAVARFIPPEYNPYSDVGQEVIKLALERCRDTV